MKLNQRGYLLHNSVCKSENVIRVEIVCCKLSAELDVFAKRNRETAPRETYIYTHSCTYTLTRTYTCTLLSQIKCGIISEILQVTILFYACEHFWTFMHTPHLKRAQAEPVSDLVFPCRDTTVYNSLLHFEWADQRKHCANICHMEQVKP